MCSKYRLHSKVYGNACIYKWSTKSCYKEIGPHAENMDTILASIVDTSEKACVLIYREIESPFEPLAIFYLNFEYEMNIFVIHNC